MNKTLRHQRLIHFLQNVIHLLPKQLIHAAQAPIPIKGRIVQIFHLNVKRRGNVVLNHPQPGDLGFVELQRPGLLTKNQLWKLRSTVLA